MPRAGVRWLRPFESNLVVIWLVTTTYTKSKSFKRIKHPDKMNGIQLDYGRSPSR